MTPTPKQALELLDKATQPENLRILKRGDFVNIQLSLEVLEAFVNEHTPKEETKP